MDTEYITTRSLAHGFAEVEPFILNETARIKTVFQPEMSENGVRGYLMRIRKGQDGNDENIVPINFNSLHPDEGVRIELCTDALNALYQRIDQLYAVLEERGVRYGTRHYAVTDANSLVITEQNKADIIRRLLDANLTDEIWEQLATANPEVATRLANTQIYGNRKVALTRFEQMIRDDTLPESTWQHFFEENTWIFGYGLRYQILNIVQGQPHYGGADYTGIGDERGDFLTHTEGDAKFTCLVEIKKPSTELLQNVAYRNGAWGISSELSGAVAQVQVNCAEWENEGSRTDRNRDQLQGIYTVSPKGIIVVGRTSQLSNRDKANSFERFRRELRNPEIITFDELLERAKFILGDGNYTVPEQDTEETEEDDLPF